MISQIVLKNFKCFESESVNISMLTLLSGLNGMGKSSLLQALLVLRQSYLEGLLPNTGLALNGSLVQMGTAQDVLYQDAQSDQFEIDIAWDDKMTARFLLQYQREADVLKIDPHSINQAIFSLPPFSDQFHYLKAERLGPRTANAVSDYQVREHRQIGSGGEYTEHFIHMYGAEIIRQRQLLYDQSDSSDLRSQVQAWLNEISPGTELNLSIHPEMDIVNLRYSMVTGSQRSGLYRSTSVGFGITYVLPVLVAVLSSQPGALLLVENPEAHLHPRGQFLIGELVARAASAGIQVVVETHSDHVLNGIRVAVHEKLIDPQSVAIHYFSRVEEHGRVHCTVDTPLLDKDGRIDKWPEGFFDQWDKSLEQLLEPRRD